jgi:hypothetical protein
VFGDVVMVVGCGVRLRKASCKGEHGRRQDLVSINEIVYIA